MRSFLVVRSTLFVRYSAATSRACGVLLIAALCVAISSGVSRGGPVTDWDRLTPQPTLDPITDVWCVSPSEVYIVDGGLMQFDGTTWNRIETGATGALRSLQVLPGGDIYAVGASGSCAHYDGTTWGNMDIGAYAGDLIGVWADSPNDVFALAGDSVYHHDGTSWANTGNVPTIAGFAFDIEGSSPTDVYVANYIGVFRYNGSMWSSSLNDGATAVALKVFSSTDVYALLDGTLYHSNGTTWSPVTSTGTAFPMDLCGTSGTDLCLLLDDTNINGGAHVHHWNGAIFDNVVSVEPANAALSGCGASDVYAVGGVSIFQYNGSVATPYSVYEIWSDLWAFGSGDVFIGGGEGTILHHDGTTLSEMTPVTSDAIVDIWGSSPSDMYFCTAATVYHWDGATWDDLVFPSNYIRAAWQVPGTLHDYLYVIAGGAGDLLYRWWGGGWTFVRQIGDIGHDVWGTYEDDVWVSTDASTSFEHFDGMNWSNVTVPTGVYTAFWGRAANDLYAVGDGFGGASDLIHYDGTLWSQVPGVPVSSTSDFRLIRGIGNDVYLGGDLNEGAGGQIWHWDGAATFTDIAMPFEIFDIAMVDADEVFFGGRDPNYVSYSGSGGVVLRSKPVASGIDPAQATPSFALYQNAPNPFSDATTIRFDLDSQSPVAIRVYDVKGRVVDTIVPGTLPAGENAVRWSARGKRLHSGVYFYKVTTQAGTRVGKMVLVH